jgi:hypothetical protein
MADTEFSAVRFSGDKTKADAVYAGMRPLTADDIAESVYWAATLPAHINGWQTNAPAQGYATYVRPFSIARGWLGPAIKVSSQYGNSQIWPGDTFGISVFPGGPGVRLAMSWGNAIGTSQDSEIYSAVVTLPATPISGR